MATVLISKLSAKEHKDLYDLATAVNFGKKGALSQQEELDHNDSRNSLSQRELDHMEQLLREQFTFENSNELARAGDSKGARAKVMQVIEAKVQEKMAILYSFAEESGSWISALGHKISSWAHSIASK